MGSVIRERESRRNERGRYSLCACCNSARRRDHGEGEGEGDIEEVG